MPSRKPEPPGAPSSLVMPPPALVGAGHPADASSHPSPSHRVLGAVKSPTPGTPDASGCPALARACGSGPRSWQGASACVSQASPWSQAGWGPLEGYPLSSRQPGVDAVPFSVVQTGPREGGSILLPSPGAPRLLSTPRPPRRLNPCDRRGHSAASRESGAAQTLQALLPGRFREQGRTLGSWPLGPWGSRRGGEARPRFQPGTRRGWRLPGSRSVLSPLPEGPLPGELPASSGNTGDGGASCAS